VWAPRRSRTPGQHGDEDGEGRAETAQSWIDGLLIIILFATRRHYSPLPTSRQPCGDYPQVVGSGAAMAGGESQGSRSDPDRPDAREQDVGAVAIGGAAQFATQVPEPQDHLLRPGMGDMIHKQGRQQDQHEEAAHAFTVRTRISSTSRPSSWSKR